MTPLIVVLATKNVRQINSVQEGNVLSLVLQVIPIVPALVQIFNRMRKTVELAEKPVALARVAVLVYA